MLKVAAPIIAAPVHGYICYQRDRLMSRASLLPDRDRLTLRQYFRPEVLDTARILFADPLPISDPPFASVMRRFRFDFPSLLSVEAITFDNVIACRFQQNASLLFHELVHVVQYRILGVSEFARRYVAGFLETQSYAEIPLEKSAFALQFRFETAAQRFDAELETRRYLESK